MHFKKSESAVWIYFINYNVDKITKTDVETDNSAAIKTEDGRGSF